MNAEDILKEAMKLSREERKKIALQLLPKPSPKTAVAGKTIRTQSPTINTR